MPRDGINTYEKESVYVMLLNKNQRWLFKSFQLHAQMKERKKENEHVLFKKRYKERIFR